MKILLRILGGLAGLVLLLVIVAYLLPRTYRIERSILIQAKAETVFPLFADLRRWQEWGAWQERDPGMKATFGEKSTGVGASYAWESKTEGNGRMTITAHEPLRRITYRLEFPDMGTASEGSMVLSAEGGGVKVVWADTGDLGLNPIFRWFGLFLDRLIGRDFEAGLAKLKRVAEAPPR